MERVRKNNKDDGNIILFAQGIFFVDLVNSNRDLFRYDLVWDKELISGHLNAKKQPLRVHEKIAVFFKNQGVYNPQFTEGKPLHSIGKAILEKPCANNNYNAHKGPNDERAGSTKKYPKSIVKFRKPHSSVALHRTEKSIELLEWLIKTYSNKNDVVLDNTAGSFTCAIASINTNRNFIGIELDKKYYEVGKKRIKDKLKNKLF
jgi:site-specific DNA-methyltransferase (adenine-specific)